MSLSISLNQFFRYPGFTTYWYIWFWW